MALESEDVSEQTSRLSSLSPEERRAYKKLVGPLWILYRRYRAVGVVVVGNANVQKADDIVAMIGTRSSH